MVLNKNNKGISYIEIILVLTIMILMTGFASVTMAIVNRNNVTKGADRIESGFAHAKTLSLSKGTDKGSITFASDGNKCFYYYGDNIHDKYVICNSPCILSIYVKGDVPNDSPFIITNSSYQIRYKFNQSTGAIDKVQKSENGGAFTDIVEGIDHFDLSAKENNKIVIENNNGKSVSLYLSVHVGKVSVSY